jgi:hypothetical protein
VVSLGFNADEKRVRKKVSGKTKAEVIYRRELRLVITTGAEVTDQIFRPSPAQGTPAGAAG